MLIFIFLLISTINMAISQNTVEKHIRILNTTDYQLKKSNIISNLTIIQKTHTTTTVASEKSHATKALTNTTNSVMQNNLKNFYLNINLKILTQNQINFLKTENLIFLKLTIRKFMGKHNENFLLHLFQNNGRFINFKNQIKLFYNENNNNNNNNKQLETIQLNLSLKNFYVICFIFTNLNETVFAGHGDDAEEQEEHMCIDVNTYKIMNYDKIYENCTFFDEVLDGVDKDDSLVFYVEHFENFIYYKPLFIPIMYVLCAGILIIITIWHHILVYNKRVKSSGTSGKKDPIQQLASTIKLSNLLSECKFSSSLEMKIISEQMTMGGSAVVTDEHMRLLESPLKHQHQQHKVHFTLDDDTNTSNTHTDSDRHSDDDHNPHSTDDSHTSDCADAVNHILNSKPWLCKDTNEAPITDSKSSLNLHIQTPQLSTAIIKTPIRVAPAPVPTKAIIKSSVSTNSINTPSNNPSSTNGLTKTVSFYDECKNMTDKSKEPKKNELVKALSIISNNSSFDKNDSTIKRIRSTTKSIYCSYESNV